jgi:hypothetical protein
MVIKTLVIALSFAIVLAVGAIIMGVLMKTKKVSKYHTIYKATFYSILSFLVTILCGIVITILLIHFWFKCPFFGVDAVAYIMIAAFFFGFCFSILIAMIVGILTFLRIMKSTRNNSGKEEEGLLS